MKVVSQLVEIHLPARQGEQVVDELMRGRASRLLQRSGYHQLRRLECQVRHGVIELHGTVSSYFLKQMAQEVLSRLDNSRVLNCIRVE